MRGLLRLVPIGAALAVVAFPAAARGSQCPDYLNAPDVCSPEIRVSLDTVSDAPNGLGTPAEVGHASTYRGPDPTVGYLYGRWTSTTTPGRFKYAFTFNGIDNGLTWDLGGSGDNHDRMSPDRVTEALWVNAPRHGLYPDRVIAVRGSRASDGLFGGHCTAYGGAWGLVTGDNGGIVFYVTLEDANSDGGITVVRTPAVPDAQVFDGTWHAVAGVFDRRPGSPSAISLWVDGRQVAAQDLPRDLTPGRLSYPPDPTGSGDDELMIAGPSDHQSRYCGAFTDPVNFAGSIDEVEIFDHALTATQLATLQSAGARTPPDVPYTPHIQGPSLTGTPQVGQPLTCTDRDGLTNQTFTWERAPRDTHFENDAGWTAINGASANTYPVQDADAGSRLRCHEYGRYQSGSAGAGYWNADRASTSVRADRGPPVNVSPPYITGDAPADPKYGSYRINPLAGHTLTCNPGTWTNGPEESAGDFTYQWVRNGTGIQGANQKTYTLTRSYDGNTLVDPHGDGGKFIECLVYARNDVGGAAPVVSSNGVRAIDGPPWLAQRPHVVLSALPPGHANPLDRHLDCVNGTWRDDYAAYGIEPFHYRFSWYRKRGNTYELIPGATDSRYKPVPEDLGRLLTCNVITGNPAGEVGVGADNEALVELPTGTVDSEIFRDGGRNPADPTNLMAISAEYKKAIEDLVLSRLHDGVTKATRACQDGTALPPGTTIPPGVPGLVKPRPHRPVKVGQPPPDNQVNTTNPIRPVDRCRVLLHAPNRLWYLTTGGVRYNVGNCRQRDEEAGLGAAGLGAADAADFTCPSIGIEVPSIDPSKPPQLPADVKALESVTPKQILWDVNGDGVVDAICPATAPVLRTIYNPGMWNPRAVIITNASAQTGHFNFAGGRPQDEFTTPGDNNQQPGTLRGDQMKVCGTSFDPPPDPDHGPCATNATFGRVNLTGNLCPIDVRAIDPQDYSNLLGRFPQVQQLLFAASQDRLKHEGAVTARNRPGSGPIVWADWGHQPAATLRSTATKASAVDTVATATAEDTVAAMTAWQSPYGFQPPSGTPHVDNVVGDATKNFALDQVMASTDPIGLNGVTQQPLNGSSALIIPSDAHAALTDTKKEVVLAARDAASHLGPPDLPDGLPLSTGGELMSTFSDVPRSPDDILRQTNLDQVKANLQKQIQGLQNQAKQEAAQRLQGILDKLDLGPFKLSGTATIHAENDGSATIEADATFPLLSTPPGNKPLAVKARIHADTQGNLALRGLHIDYPGNTYLGALQLSKLLLDYNSNSGMTIKGLINISAVGGIDIHNFQIDQHGNFQALDVDYLAAAGQGIYVGPGLYLTTIGGGLNLPQDLIDAHAVLSAGPSPGGGCPTAGIDGHFFLHFGNPVAFDSTANVNLLCIPLANMVFHADANGLVTINGGAHLDLGPVYADVTIGAGIDFGQQQPGAPLPPWQAYAKGSGGVRDLFSGQVRAVLSNLGIAGCGSIQADVPLVGEFVGLFSGKPKHYTITISGGASVDFVNDLPPLDLTTLIANLNLFTGCDIDRFLPLGPPPGFRARAAANGGFPFQVNNLGASAFSIEGAGGAPRVQLRDPQGRVYDFTNAVSKGLPIGNSVWGKVLESADKTIVLVGNPAPGTWTAIPAPGSPRIIRVRAARLLPPPSITAQVTGHRLKRTLTYNVTPISGQVVKFVEFAGGGQQVIRTVTTGGHGRVRFTPAEATDTHRTIVAQVTQSNSPRENLTVAHYVATGPTIGRARHIRVRRHGTQAIVTWKRASLGHSYQVTVRYGDGQNIILAPQAGARRIVVPGVSRREGLRIWIVAISPRGRRGPAARARLPGNMQVGKTRHLSPHKKRGA